VWVDAPDGGVQRLSSAGSYLRWQEALGCSCLDGLGGCALALIDTSFPTGTVTNIVSKGEHRQLTPKHRFLQFDPSLFFSGQTTSDASEMEKVAVRADRGGMTARFLGCAVEYHE